MKQLLYLFLSFFIFPAYAVTSESYVDSAVAPLQNKIPAVNTNTVLTNTGAAGEIGTKKIYDDTKSFTTQTDALITAETFNAAVQNAIDTEFVCIESIPEGCLLYQIVPRANAVQGVFQGPYLGGLNKNVVLVRAGYQVISSPFTPSSAFQGPVSLASVIPGQKYKFTVNTNATYCHFTFYANKSDILTKNNPIQLMACYGYFIVPANAHWLGVALTRPDKSTITWDNFKLEPVYF